MVSPVAGPSDRGYIAAHQPALPRCTPFPACLPAAGLGISMVTRVALARHTPALTSTQRFHLATYGFVVVPSVLSDAECSVLLAELQSLRNHRPAGSTAVVREAAERTGLTNLLECGGFITGYAVHPYLVSLAEELVGGEVRILEQNAIINTKRADRSEPFAPGWHRGTDSPFASMVKNSMWHCSFVKTLTNLTPLRGPEDGGTLVIPGSHRADAPAEVMIQMAQDDPSLVHQVVAPAGSTLLFGESLIHATSEITSERERTIITTGYGPPMFP